MLRLSLDPLSPERVFFAQPDALLLWTPIHRCLLRRVARSRACNVDGSIIFDGGIAHIVEMDYLGWSLPASAA